jgi:PAS domain S-box-containing protein
MSEFVHSQSDYLIFIASVLAVFAGLAIALPRWWQGMRLPWLTWPVVALVLAAGWFPVQWAGDGEREQIEALVSSMAPTYAHELEHAGHWRITTATPPEDPVYRHILELERDWTRLNPAAHDIYTMRRRGDGKRIFIADADTDYDRDGKMEEKERGAANGEVYEEEDAGLDKALDGQANFNRKIVTDKWGSWVGAWAPIYDPLGKIEAVVGVDYDAHDWLEAIADARGDRIKELAFVLATIGAAMVGVGRMQTDMAHRRRAEAEHQRADERWHRIFEQLPLAYAEWDPNGMVTEWNPSAERIFGWRRDEVLGRSNLEFIVAPSARQHVAGLWRELGSQSGGTHSVNENVTRDGRTITCEWFNAAVVGPDGKVVSVMSLAQDISERLGLEEQVRQSQKLTSVGQLAAGVAHDFNNILTVIQGHADLLLHRTDLAGDAKVDIERISAAAERAANLTRQLLTFSRKQAMFARSLDLNGVVNEAAHLLTRVLGATILVRCDLATDLPAVEADPTMLDHAITNLALNARDAMAGGGTLTLATRLVTITAEAAEANPERRVGAAVGLTISDTGTGISTEHLARIFEPFFTTKQVGKGTGLGLAAVHGIVKQHRGWIEVRSAVGAGTTIEIFLPPSDQPATSAARAPAAVAPPEPALGRTILLVEDEQTVRALARIALEREGFTVLEAEDGPTALRLWAARRDDIALLFTDMVMPNGLDGRALATRLLAERPALPVLYASGYSVELAAPDFAELPTQSFMQKPYLPADLIAQVQRLLGSAKAGTDSNRKGPAKLTSKLKRS